MITSARAAYSRASQKQNSQPSFQKNYLIQISKKAFEHPENLSEVEETFSKAFTERKGGKTSKLKILLAIFGIKKQNIKAVKYLESPFYTNLVKRCKKAGDYGLNWFSQNLGVPQIKPIDEKYHSFQVHTQEDKDKFISLAGTTSRLAMNKDLKQERVAKFPMTNCSTFREIIAESKRITSWTLAKQDGIISKQMAENTNPTIAIKVESLDALPEALKQIEF